MYYEIDKTALRGKIEEEVSLAADEAYSEDGVSLYDAIILTEKDWPAVDRFIDDAVTLFVRREFDVTKYAPRVNYAEGTDTIVSVTPRLEFYVPDFDSTMEDAFKAELTRYIVIYAAASVFQQRRAVLAPEYTERAKAAMDSAVALLKFRKHPITTW